MDVVELTALGAKIVEIGERLKGLREQRDQVNAEISTLEKELMPLVTRHATIIAEIVGNPVSAPPPQQSVPGPNNGVVPVSPHQQGPQMSDAEVRRRIEAFLQDAEPGTSAADIAQSLRLDPLVVRRIMGEMSRSGR